MKNFLHRIEHWLDSWTPSQVVFLILVALTFWLIGNEQLLQRILK